METENTTAYEGAAYAADVALERARNGDIDGVAEPTRAVRERLDGAPFPALIERIERAATAALSAATATRPEREQVLTHLSGMRDGVERLGIEAREDARLRPFGTSRDPEE